MTDLGFEEAIKECAKYKKNLLLGNGFSMAYDDAAFNYKHLLEDSYNLSAKMEYVWHEMECRLILKILCGKSFHFKSRTSQME